jgi:hypothetical protein
MRLIQALPVASCLILVAAAAAAAEPAQTEAPACAASADRFLDSLGINTHIDQGYDAESYVEPLRYTGIRQVRDGERNVASDVMVHQKTGVHFTVSAAGDLDGLIATAHVLAAAGALLALEGPNEPNNFPITYNGQRGGGRGKSWRAVAAYQQDLYRVSKSDPLLASYPVFGPSETGAETDDVGLQFATTPTGTHYADYLNMHNYVTGKGNRYGDNQAWKAADPTLDARWDGLYGNSGVTWLRHYEGYDDAALKQVPRVTTETGWDSIVNAGGPHTQGTILVNTYLAQFKRGWRYTFIYEMRDGEGGPGSQGIYSGSAPKLAATYIHNLTTILSDHQPLPQPGCMPYTIANQTATVHDLLLQKSTGVFDLILWDERVHGDDRITVHLGGAPRAVQVYDVTVGTDPVDHLNDVSAVDLQLNNHAMILEFNP